MRHYVILHHKPHHITMHHVTSKSKQFQFTTSPQPYHLYHTIFDVLLLYWTFSVPFVSSCPMKYTPHLFSFKMIAMFIYFALIGSSHLTHRFTDSSIHTLTHSHIDSSIQSFTHSFIHSLFNSFINIYTYNPGTSQVLQSWGRGLTKKSKLCKNHPPLVDWLIDWLTDWLAGWLADWLTGW